MENEVILFNLYIKKTIFNCERWLSGLKRHITNPLYELFVMRVQIPFKFENFDPRFFIKVNIWNIQKKKKETQHFLFFTS